MSTIKTLTVVPNHPEDVSALLRHVLGLAGAWRAYQLHAGAGDGRAEIAAGMLEEGLASCEPLLQGIRADYAGAIADCFAQACGRIERSVTAEGNPSV